MDEKQHRANTRKVKTKYVTEKKQNKNTVGIKVKEIL